MADNNNDFNLIKLRSNISEIELTLIKEILEDNNVSYIVRDQGAGGYMRIIGGRSIFGTDIMVAEADFDKANSLLESIGIG